MTAVWIEIGAHEVPAAAFPDPWDSGDIEALIRDGYLQRLAREVTSDDGSDTRTTCRLTDLDLGGRVAS